MNIFLRFILFVFFAFAGQSYATTAVAYGYEDNVFQAGVENLNNNGLINPSGCCSNLSARDSQDRAQARPFFAFAADFVVPKGKLSQIDEFQDLTDFRRDHILNRHRAGTGKSEKTEFPSTWSDDRIIHQVSDVATDPNSVPGVGKWDSPYVVGTRDGIEIRVDFYPDKLPNGQPHPNAGKISTAYPINTPANP